MTVARSRRRLARAALVAAGWLALGAPAGAAPLAPFDVCTDPGWHPIESSGRNVSTLAGSAAMDRVFAGSLQPDGAATVYTGRVTETRWAPVDGMGTVAVTDIALNPGAPVQTWVATFGDGVFGSTDGATGFGLRGQLVNGWATALAPIPGGVVAAFSEPAVHGVYFWNGTDWSPTGDSTTIETSLIWKLASGADGRVWAALDARGVWRLDPAAATWLQVGDQSLRGSTVLALAVDPKDPDRVYAGLGPALDAETLPYAQGVRTSGNAGLEWSAAGLGDMNAIPDLTPTSRPFVVYASAWGAGLRVSSGLVRDEKVHLVWRTAPPPPATRAAGFFNAVFAIVPPGQAPEQCELLFVGAADGVWARNIAGVIYRSVYLPTLAGGGRPAGAAVTTYPLAVPGR